MVEPSPCKKKGIGRWGPSPNDEEELKPPTTKARLKQPLQNHPSGGEYVYIYIYISVCVRVCLVYISILSIYLILHMRHGQPLKPVGSEKFNSWKPFSSGVSSSLWLHGLVMHQTHQNQSLPRTKGTSRSSRNGISGI